MSYFKIHIYFYIFRNRIDDFIRRLKWIRTLQKNTRTVIEIYVNNKTIEPSHTGIHRKLTVFLMNQSNQTSPPNENVSASITSSKFLYFCTKYCTGRKNTLCKRYCRLLLPTWRVKTVRWGLQSFAVNMSFCQLPSKCRLYSKVTQRNACAQGGEGN